MYEQHPSPARPRRTILVVDDETINRQMLGFMLSAQYEVLYAENGLEAWAMIEQYAEKLSLVILDILMPEMDGLQLLEKVKTSKAYCNIPVMMLTSDKESELTALRLGAMDFITKPYDAPEIILARIQRIIEFVEDKQIIQDYEHDPLTGLYTDGFFQEYCHREMLHGPQRDMDMLAINIDRFRLINEVGGKALGNQVLSAVAGGIQDVIREGFGIGCRTGADQFYLFLNHSDHPSRVRERIACRLAPLAGQVTVHLRMGVYSKVNRERGVDWFMEAALSACNAVRGKYTEQIQFYDDALHQQELKNERLLADMQQALREKQFVVYFQPKYSISEDQPKLYSAEALVRWIHPEFGFISPGQFIPLFEENGVINLLDEFVWNEAAAQIRRWRDEFGVRLPVSVNVSRMDFFTGELKEKLLSIVSENGISVKDLVLEITESAYSQNINQVLDSIKELRQLGFQIEMDDFGSGYSSLSMLTLMPVDAIKIDMNFVKGLMTNKTGYQLLELVIQMVECLNVASIVEGVETKEQYELMKRAQCSVIQGYYFSRPLNQADFTQLLARENGLENG